MMLQARILTCLFQTTIISKKKYNKGYLFISLKKLIFSSELYHQWHQYFVSPILAILKLYWITLPRK